MNKYVVAFYSSMLAELRQEIVEAKTALEAGLSYLNWWEESEQPTTLEELYTEAFSSDCHIHVLDLNKALKTNGGGTKLQPSVGQFESDSGFH